MQWLQRFFFAAQVSLFVSTSLASAALAPLHHSFAAHDQRIAVEKTHWHVAYQNALALAHSAEPQRALRALEALLENLAEQEIPFSRVYARYFSLAEHLAQRQDTVPFLQQLAKRHPTPWVLGVQHESATLVENRTRTLALFSRLQAAAETSPLASEIQTLYRLIWPYTASGEARHKAELATALANSQGADFDRRGIDQLARWHYHPEPTTSADEVVHWQNTLQQALQDGPAQATLAALSHYLAALLSHNQLQAGADWAHARLQAGDRSPTLILIADLLDTAQANQQQVERALNTIANLQQMAPDSLLLVLTESSLRYHALIQGYPQADAILAAFGQRQPHNARIQHAIQSHRSLLADWAALPTRAKRSNTLPAVLVTANRPSQGSGFSDIGLEIGSTADVRRLLGQGGCPSQLTPTIVPVARRLPKLPSKIAPAVRADNPATAPQLAKQLASEAQLAALKASGGRAMAGPGMKDRVDDAPRLIVQYGGRASDWFKVSSQSHRAADGTQFEIHGYWNATTKQLVEPKTIIIRTP